MQRMRVTSSASSSLSHPPSRIPLLAFSLGRTSWANRISSQLLCLLVSAVPLSLLPRLRDLDAMEDDCRDESTSIAISAAGIETFLGLRRRDVALCQSSPCQQLPTALRMPDTLELALFTACHPSVTKIL